MAEGNHTPHHAGRSGKGVVGYIKTAVATVVLVAVLAGAGFVALSLFRGTWMVTPVLSGSMRPGFSVGGVVISERTPLSDIAVRDVIVFQNPIKRTIQMIHRIIKLTRESGGAIKIKTLGDANPVPDPWTVVIKTHEVYQIKASVPLVGYVAVAYQNYRGLFVAVAGVLLLVVPIGYWLASRGERGAEEPEVEASEEEPAPPFTTRALAMGAEPDESGGGTGGDSSERGLPWRPRSGGLAHTATTERVLRSYRIAIRVLMAALIVALGLLGATASPDHRWLFVAVAGLLVLVVVATAWLPFPKRRPRPNEAENAETDAAEAVRLPELRAEEEGAVEADAPKPPTAGEQVGVVGGASDPDLSEPETERAHSEDPDTKECSVIDEPLGAGATRRDSAHDHAADDETLLLAPREPVDAGSGQR